MPEQNEDAEILKEVFKGYYDSDIMSINKVKIKVQEAIALTRQAEQKRILEDNRWLEFREEKPKQKTKVFSVWSKCSGIKLGEIKWYPNWRHYCFVEDDKVYSDRCNLQIGYFTEKLNREHKELKSKISEEKK